MLRLVPVLLLTAGLVPAPGVAQISAPEREALVELFFSTNGPQWDVKTNWLDSPGTECTWFGVTCVSASVHELVLPGNGLVGALPPELGQLASLSRLNLQDNELEGELPGELGAATGLEYLYLDWNSLEGSIPSELGGLGQLKALGLYDNELTGTIPIELGDLGNLETLSLGRNWLTGQIPSQLGRLKELALLVLSENHLSGPIPKQVGNLKKLHGLLLSGNYLGGELPSALGGLTNLEYLLLDNNRLNGVIPSSLYSLSSLWDVQGLSLCGNSLRSADQALSYYLNTKHTQYGPWQDCQVLGGDGIFWEDFEDGHAYAWSLGVNLEPAPPPGSQPPFARIQLPGGPIYGGTFVTFQDASSQSPDSWSWKLLDGATEIDTKVVQNPTFSLPDEGPYPHTYTVQLDARNSIGWSETSAVETFQALDPAPSAVVTANVSQSTPCGTVNFALSDLTGVGSPTRSWDVINGSGASQGQSGSGNSLEWILPGNQALGNYRGELTLSNAFGTETFTSPVVQVQALPTLGAPQLAAPAVEFGNVDFSVSAAGATEWTWDFGDGTVESYTDPTIGPNPSHSYDAVGSYSVTVTVDNCRDAEKSTSQTVQIDEIVQLAVKKFDPQLFCVGSLCEGTANVPIGFTTIAEGNPTLFEYDWDGDGSWDETSTTLVTTHTFTTLGSFTPKLRITRGSATAEGTSKTISLSVGARMSRSSRAEGLSSAPRGPILRPGSCGSLSLEPTIGFERTAC